jgi:hypothetical protein
MGAAGKVGGVLALIGGALVLIESLLILMGTALFGTLIEATWLLGASMMIIWPILSLLLGVVALVGGILALSGKKVGGVLALIIAILWIIYPLLFQLGVFVPDLVVLTPMGLLTGLLDFGLWIFTIEGIIVLVGGILGLAASND